MKKSSVSKTWSDMPLRHRISPGVEELLSTHHTRRVQRSCIAWLVCLLYFLPPLALAERLPNMVVLYADDLGWGDVGFNGRKEWQTPHLDRLAQQGMVFTRWYAAATVCAPSRAAFVTGQYGIHNGVSGNNDDLPRNKVTIASALNSRGYKTALFGKWHHGCEGVPNYAYIHPMDLGLRNFLALPALSMHGSISPKNCGSDENANRSPGTQTHCLPIVALSSLARTSTRRFFSILRTRLRTLVLRPCRRISPSTKESLPKSILNVRSTRPMLR
ncbi:MAG: hypothetical protein FJ147_21365 [Deltaproteobacteria bacterium]|nr:hypothetical protein [Deltaproteobacteria bacterium]